MINSITSVELDLVKFPITISAYNGEMLVKKWEFTSESEAKKAQSSIWKEILKSKVGGKNGTKTVSD